MRHCSCHCDGAMLQPSDTSILSTSSSRPQVHGKHAIQMSGTPLPSFLTEVTASVMRACCVKEGRHGQPSGVPAHEQPKLGLS